MNLIKNFIPLMSFSILSRISFKVISPLVILCLSAVWIAGCSGKVKYYPGFYTKYVKGVIKLSETGEYNSAFIIVRKYNRSFIETSQGPLDRVSVAIVHPENDGTYIVHFDDATISLETLFIAKSHRSQSFHLSRALGVGYYKIDVELPKDSNWENNFYFVIKPLLSDYITESRYQLPNFEKKFLGDWLTSSETALENNR